jgi:hypothetical protein
MRTGLLTTVAAGLLLAACTSTSPLSSATPEPTGGVVPTAAGLPPTPAGSALASVSPSASAAAPSPSLSAGAFNGQPYTITLPAAWQAFNLADPAAKAGLDSFVAANPNIAASVKLFEGIPGVRMAVNPVLGNVMLLFTTPSGGLPLGTLATSFTAQFQAVPGLTGTPSPQKVTLPGGDAIHWAIAIKANKAGGGTLSVAESVYLFASSTDAVILEFATLTGGAIPDEQAIASSFAFKR